MQKYRKFTIIPTIILVFALIGMVFAYKTEQANAGAVIFDPLELLDEFIISPLVRQIANSLENKVVNRVNKLISNIDGKTPSYITNWRNYILESEARGNDVFRGILADSNLCPYFKNSLVRGFGAEQSVGVTLGAKIRRGIAGPVLYENKLSVPGEPSFRDTSRCTLPDGFDINKFKKDFNAGGGWDAWNRLIQPQNNFLGAYSLALAEQEKQKQIEKNAARDSSVAGGGFKGQKLGADNLASPNGCAGVSLPGNLPTRDQFELLSITSANVRCSFLGKEITPARILGESAANALDAKIGRVGSAAYLTDIVLTVVGGLIQGVSDKLTNFSGQSSYDKPPSPPEDYKPSTKDFDQSDIPKDDPNFDNEVNRIEQGAQDSCRSDCIQSADCNQTDPETGLPDQAAQDQCRSDAESSCTTQCSSI